MIRPAFPFPRRWLFALLLALAAVPCPAFQSAGTALDREAPFRRMLWVSRFEYSTAEDIQKVFYNAASARFTDVFFQVRGEGTVYFRSSIEPWAWQLSGLGVERGVGVTPRWDPLAVAIREAHRWGIRIHAYVNVLPAWGQDKLPARDSGQLYVARRNWLMTGRDGRRMEPDGFYAFLEPGLPEVRQYLGRLFAELAATYRVDGIHLDYIRYPHPKEVPGVSYHPRVVADFESFYKQTPEQAPETWSAFRQRQVTETVREIRRAIDAVRPGLPLSAAVYSNPAEARDTIGQDSIRWVTEGLVDFIVPMVYVDRIDVFRDRLIPYLRPPLRGRVYIGIQAKEENRQLYNQIRFAVARNMPGISIFSYGDLYDGHAATTKAVSVYRTFMAARPGMAFDLIDAQRNPNPPVDLKAAKPGVKIIKQ